MEDFNNIFSFIPGGYFEHGNIDMEFSEKRSTRFGYQDQPVFENIAGRWERLNRF